jgi:ribonucleoside-diphosphate reductase alpha chain
MKTTNKRVGRLFTDAKTKAYDQIKWAERDSIITNPLANTPVFEQFGVEFPSKWSTNAINIVAQKYFIGSIGQESRESSLKDLIDRVVDTLTKHGLQENYFSSEAEAEDFKEELKYVLATQRASFNSPVWFNIGTSHRAQQASACFILGVQDTMPSVNNWHQDEGLIFKSGSGSGVNLSVISSSAENMDKGSGTVSNPLSLMRGADVLAGTIKSDASTRRASKIVILNADHPDIEEFTWAKAVEERKSRTLQEAGFDVGRGGKDAFSIQYQHTNSSVRVSDDFMLAVTNDADWDLMSVNNSKKVKTIKARDLFSQFAEAAWECADPGIQFDTTINNWHTTPNAGRINGSNPSSEYMHLDNSACNLASLNLLKYLREDNSFDIDAFKHSIELIFTAQEILVSYSDYPTETIAKNARAYRQLGLGYANLGALLMAQGLAYDSAEGRAQAAAITALMTGCAYSTSAKIAQKVGPFAGYHKDQKNMNSILKQHRAAVDGIDPSMVSEQLLSAATTIWDEAIELAETYGVRNSQASALAPTGTIGLMMDCETTGIEPYLSLVKIKKLTNGEITSSVNETAPKALKSLNYDEKQIKEIIEYINEEKTIIDAPHLRKEHSDVFACSMGENAIHYLGHLKMVSAVQPFISGAISKTINIPEQVSVKDVEQLYLDAWKMRVKTLNIYRDNCKSLQIPSKTTKDDTEETPTDTESISVNEDLFTLKGAVRRDLPKIRPSKTFSFTVADCHGYFTVGEYDDGTPGELFISVAKMGSTLAGLMDSFARSVSYGLQFGVPLKVYVKGMTSMSFAPAGITDDQEIRTASSLIDYIFRRLAKDYLSFDDRLELGFASIDDMPIDQTSLLEEGEMSSMGTVDEPTDLPEVSLSDENEAPIAAIQKPKPIEVDNDAPMCYNCGNQTQRSGSCYVCISCGSTTGCS